MDEKEKSVPMNGVSELGSAALKEISKSRDYYANFLRLQGRLYKFPATVALEFFAQKPDTDCIATENQWKRLGYELNIKSRGINFIDSKGNRRSYYDFSQVTNQNRPPERWAVTSENVSMVKEYLSSTNNIPDTAKNSLISMTLYCADIFNDVNQCVSAINVPKENVQSFFASYVNAFSLIVAGRLEVNSKHFDISADLSFFNSFQSDEEKIVFLSYVGRTARQALSIIEKAVTNSEEIRRGAYELPDVDNIDNRTERESFRRGVSVSSAERPSEEQSVGSNSDKEEQQSGLAIEEGERRSLGGEHDDNQFSSRQSSADIPTQSAERNLRDSSGSATGEVDGRRTDRRSGNEMDDVHGGELSSRSGGSEVQTQISDVSTSSSGVSRPILGDTGQSVQNTEPSSDRGLSGNSEMGGNEEVLHRQRSNEGESSDKADTNRLNEKIANVFSENNNEPSTENIADGSSFSAESFSDKVNAAIDLTTKKYNLSEEQKSALSRFGRFAVKYQLIEGIIDEAFKRAPVFRTNYKDREYLDKTVFKSNLTSIENDISQYLSGNETVFESSMLDIQPEIIDDESAQIRKHEIEKAIKDTEKRIENANDNDTERLENILKFFQAALVDDTLEITTASLEAFIKNNSEVDTNINSNPIPNGIVEEFRHKTDNFFKRIDNYSASDIEKIVKEDAERIFSENEIDATINSVILSGSRCRGLENENSDIDVVIEVESSLKEYALFNILNEQNNIEIGGFKVDINPIKADETGSLEIYLPTVEQHLTLEKAKQLINDFCEAEYSEPATFENLHNIGIAHTTITDNDLPVQVTIDLVDLKVTYQFCNEVYKTEQYNSLDEMSENCLKHLDFDDLVSVPDEIIEKYIAKFSQEEENNAEIASTSIQSGEQLTLIDVPVSEKTKTEKKKGEYSTDVIIDGIQVFEALAAELDNGVVFTDGKLHVQEYYDEQHPTLEKLADFLKNEYGISSYRYEGRISSVDTNENGLIFNFQNGEKYLHSWYNVASMTEYRLYNNTYLSAEQRNLYEQNKKEKSTRRTIKNNLYDKFIKMYPEIVNGEHTFERYGNRYIEDSENDAFEPLSIEKIGKDEYSFMMWYVQNGDLMRDPDFTFQLDNQAKTLTILSYQQDGVPPFGTYYKEVFDENGEPDNKLLASLSNNFMHVLNNTENYQRELNEYIDKEGNEVTLINEETAEYSEKVVEEYENTDDISAEWREALNAYSELHNLGELNIRPINNYRWEISEKMIDNTEVSLITLSTYDTDGKPFTNDSLLNALKTYDNTINIDISSNMRRQNALKENNNITTDLPKIVQLPEIHYAEHPSERIRDNLNALEELARLEECKANGRPLYRIDDKDNPAFYDTLTIRHTKAESDFILRKYCGWGGLPQVFDERYNTHENTRQRLKAMLTDTQYKEARASTLNAHYTPSIIIDAMYEAVVNMDLPRNAKILEPSCGTGNFITRLPNRFHEQGSVTGVELDTLTAKIAEYLNNNNKNVQIINSGFENTNFENGSFDLAIGNVPFGDYKMIDPDYKKDYLIHDAFFRKALDKVAEGGIVAFVTSSGTLDKQNAQVREHLATYADLVGAIRLPNNAFTSAGTSVTTDIIFLQKRKTPLQPFEAKPDWCYTAANKDGLRINSYFVKHNNMILGKMEKTSHFDMLTCTPIEGSDLKEQLSDAIKNINAVVTIERREKLLNEIKNGVEPWGKNFTYQIKDNEVYYRSNSSMQKIDLKKADKQIVIDLCELRDIARNLIELQKTEISDEELAIYRNKLNEKYDNFTKKQLYLSSPKVKKLFKDDSDYQLLASLEDIAETQDENGNVNIEIKKAAIFNQRTVNAEIVISEVDTAEEALEVSLDQHGKPDLLYMASLMMNKYPDASLNEIAETICNELLEKEYLYNDPSLEIPERLYSGIVEKSEYLSGNVRQKLVFAKEAAQNEPERYNKNVEALKNVVPADIHAEEISARMGCTWIDTEDYTDFLHYLSGRSDSNRNSRQVNYYPSTGSYEITNSGSTKNLNVKETSNYGVDEKYSMYKIAENVLNQKKITIYNNTKPRTVNATATKVANDKAKIIKNEFTKWIFADEYRKAKYERRYNDMFNSIVGRNYDGSKLTFSGMNKDFSLRPHQKDCIARAIYGGNTLAAHVVGAGKSAVMFATVMKKKQLGLIHKACVVVPKPLVEQTAYEWRRVYPDAKLLTVSNKDLSDEKNRELFMSRVATGAYDGVIMSQEQYEKIPMTAEFIEEHINRQIDKLTDANNREINNNSGIKTQTVKENEKAIKRYRAELEALLKPKSKSKEKDTILNFEQLGFDFLVVDEAHAYKNGKIFTKMSNIAGVSSKASGRSADMFLKADYFNEQLGDGHILFCTGTPVSNSMTELYVMTRFLRPDLLKAVDVELFDNWAATFGNVVTGYKQGADGKLSLKTSFSQFQNLPELMAMYKEFADIQSVEKLHLPRPELKGGKPQIITVEASPEQTIYVKALASRSELINQGAVQPTVDNMLKITHEARLIGLGNRVIEKLYAKRDEPLPEGFDITEPSKIDKCIDNVLNIYKTQNELDNKKAVQIIFSDIAVNSEGGNFSAYEYMKEKFIANGIPENEIQFAPKSDAKDRADIFKQINEGKKRIVIASTSTLGTGANIQQNLYALHHLDIPWKPSDFEQREGRILRQGNANKEVEIFNYVTKGTLDSYLYQTVTDKAKFIAQLLDNKCPSRVCEDCDEKVLTYGEIQAAAEGNSAFRERIEKGNELAELKLLQSNYIYQTGEMRHKLEEMKIELEKCQALIINLNQDKKIMPQEITITTNEGKTITDEKEIKQFIDELTLNPFAQEKHINRKEEPDFNIGQFKVRFGKYVFDRQFVFEIEGNAIHQCDASIAEGANNFQRLKNFFNKPLDERIEKVENHCAELEVNIAQATERIAIPFDKENEIKKLEEDIEKLEIELAGIKEQTDVIDDLSGEISDENTNEISDMYNDNDESDYYPNHSNSMGGR